MSKRHYPRYDSRKKLSPHTTKCCQYGTCTDQAVWKVFVQVNFMRGEDEDYNVCEAHRKFDDPERLDDWVSQMVAR